MNNKYGKNKYCSQESQEPDLKPENSSTKDTKETKEV